MARIERLAPELANQIAAGEVVERPASVVKELVENAIDAGARHVAVVIELGGKQRIRVEDDGEGMDRDDAVLALERHATSKIRRASDLAAIATLGFRGEALPSIASVSRLVLRTRARGATVGTEVRVEAGVLQSVKDAGAADGTVVDVADLFHNLPARRKFLKSDVAESAQVSRVVTQMALCYPEVGFTLVSAGRTSLKAPPVASPEERFFQICGERQDLVRVDKTAAGLRVSGYVAALAEQGPVRGPQHVFVNRRIVKDRTIAHAILAAYAAATIKERSPEVHLFIEMPADRVDVNVHPTKAEVRFLEQSLVHEVLRRALMDALGAPATPELQLSAPRLPESVPVSTPLPGVVGSLIDATRWNPSGALAGTRWGGADPPRYGGGTPVGVGIPTLPAVQVPEDTAAARQSVVDAVRPMSPLGQFRDTYIVAVDDEGIAIVDQHVAHERVLFEQVLDSLRAGRLPSQRLLAPIVIDLPAGQADALAARSEELERLGFEVEPFGGASVRVGAVPSIVSVEAAAGAVHALAADLDGLERGGPVDVALSHIAATIACHAAVKANQPLTLDKMRFLLEELRRTAYSTICPHGRPVVLRLTRREIEKNFQRI